MSTTEPSTAVYHELKLDKDVQVPLSDGSHLVADVFRPAGAGRFPAVMTLGPYSKDIHFRDWNKNLHTGGRYDSHVLLPVVPGRR